MQANRPARKKKSDKHAAVAWTPALRAEIFASRTQPNPHHTVPLVELDAAWERVLAWQVPTETLALIERSIVHLTDERLAEATRRALAAYGQRLAVLDPHVEAVMVLLGLRPSVDAMNLWLAHGIAVAADMVNRFARMSTNRYESKVPDALFVVDHATSGGGQVAEHAALWVMFRAALATASDAEFVAANATVHVGFATKAASAAVAFAFPEKRWDEHAIDVWLEWKPADPTHTAWQMLMASSTTRQTLRIAALPFSLERRYALTMLAWHGSDAAKIIERAFTQRGERLAMFAEVLALIRTPEALAAFMPVRDEPEVASWFAEACMAQPEAARALLADADGKAARAILARLPDV